MITTVQLEMYADLIRFHTQRHQHTENGWEFSSDTPFPLLRDLLGIKSGELQLAVWPSVEAGWTVSQLGDGITACIQPDRADARHVLTHYVDAAALAQLLVEVRDPQPGALVCIRSEIDLFWRRGKRLPVP